jgi:hypothetical protein
MDKPSAPPSPDYNSIAQQQGQNQLDLAKLTNPNVQSPYGSQTYYSSGTSADAYRTGLERQISDLQAQKPVWENWDWRYANNLATGDNASERAAQWFINTNQSLDKQITEAQRALSDFEAGGGIVPTDRDRPTMVQTLSPEQQALYQKQMQMKGLLGDLGIQGIESMQGLVGSPVDLGGLPSVSSGADTRQRVFDAMMSRVNEDTGRQREDVNSNLVAAGFRPGSAGYDDRMNLVNRQYNDARNQAFLGAGQEAQREFGMDTQRRAQSLSELLTSRQVPLNEITALMSGSQVQNPFAMPGYNATMPQGTPYMQAAQLGSNYATDLYNMQAAQAGNINQGLFGLGAAGIAAFSDRRLKSNILRIGTLPSGIPWYSYDIFGHTEEGVMADEVEAVMPEAVMTHESGYKMVDYGRLS